MSTAWPVGLVHSTVTSSGTVSTGGVMSLTVTLVVLGVALLVGIFANVRSRRPPEPR